MKAKGKFALHSVECTALYLYCKVNVDLYSALS